MSVRKLNTNGNQNSAKTLAKNLSFFLSKKNLSENDLAKELNIPYNTIHRLIEGTTTDPRMSTLVLIANYFNITIDQLLSNEPDTETTNITGNLPKLVPIFTWENLQDTEFTKNVILDEWGNWTHIINNKSQTIGTNCYGLESRPSMYPRFFLGTTLIIDPDESPIDGDLILIRIKKSGEITLRDLIMDAPNWQLSPTVVGSDILIFDENKHTIIGVVVLTMFHARPN